MDGGSLDLLGALWVMLRWYIVLTFFGAAWTRGHRRRVSRAEILGAKRAGVDETSESLSDVVGLESVKEDVRQYAEYAANPEKYKGWDVTLPKGVLLAGPPGTGKTLLVKAVARDMGVAVESMCASEFVEMYVGVGASRVRELFARAKGHGQCIVFIDEIDAVGRPRGSDRNSERDSTLNQLLVEMDGFGAGDGVIVFAATNLASQLDSALTRSGRFDRKVYFDRPNARERAVMWDKFTAACGLPRSCTSGSLARQSAGMTGADIANACNLAKLSAIKRGCARRKLSEADLRSAIEEVLVGREKRERTMSEPERRRVAHHEAGHAIVAHVLEQCEPPTKVSIVPRGEAALGFSQQEQDDAKLHTREAILGRIAVLMGGRAAERVMCGGVSTGASDDIEKASVLARRFVGEWGMDPSTGPVHASALEKDIGERCTKVVEALDQQATALVTLHEQALRRFASALLEKETLVGVDLQKVLPARIRGVSRPSTP